MSKKITKEEFDKHSSINLGEQWIIIDGKVYDITKFKSIHPGGKKILADMTGKDASQMFHEFHKDSVLEKYENLCIGELISTSNTEVNKNSVRKRHERVIPYSEPSWYFNGLSPFFTKKSHTDFRKAVRKFMESEVLPNVAEWSDGKSFTFSNSIQKKFYEAGIYPGFSGVGYWPSKYAGTLIAGGVPPEEWDYFHELILHDEVARCASLGVCSMIGEGISLGLPPILQFGSTSLKDRVCRDIIRGDKIIALAITEPSAGSDVANIQTTAVKSPDGKYFIVNGNKKWITSGTFADYFTVAVRTNDTPGMAGLSLLLLERSQGGISTKLMNCTGGWNSGTSFITFEDAKVPVENLIGKEGRGFKYIMFNFNHERFTIICQAVRMARICFEECFIYAHKRKTFGTLLIEKGVIRAKLANMVRLVESTQSYLEMLTYQMVKMSHEEANVKLGSAFALLKAHSGSILEFCAREAVQIMGGIGYTRTGQGANIERIYRDAKGIPIVGGSEEVLLDLGVRQTIKNSSKI